MIITGTSTWQLRDSERVIAGKTSLLGRKHKPAGITRLRGEALILPDTLDDLAGQVVGSSPMTMPART